jgi:tRNA-dihydrouridine synthase
MNQEYQIYFAPFQGITNSIFRKIYAKHFQGIDKFYTPYFNKILTHNKLDSQKLGSLKNSYDKDINLVPQILSRNAEEIILFAQHCKEFGYKEINWNLGCPYPQVANKKLGSGLLPHPEMIDELLQKVMQEINISLSIKCRLGYHSSDEILNLIPIFNAYPIHELRIHARIGKQLYSGNTDLETFSFISTKLNHTVVYNGDIFNVADYNQFKSHFPHIKKIMLGRGILTNPFMPVQIKRMNLPSNAAEKLRLFIDDLYFTYRKEKNDQLSLLSALKEYWIYFANAFAEPGKVLKKLKKCKQFDDYEDAVSAIFEENQLIIKRV